MRGARHILTHFFFTSEFSLNSDWADRVKNEGWRRFQVITSDALAVRILPDTNTNEILYLNKILFTKEILQSIIFH